MWYALFATTTASAAMYELFIPVMKQIGKVEPKNNIMEYKWITYITFFLLSFITAPLILPSCLVPRFSDRFKEALLKSLV